MQETPGAYVRDWNCDMASATSGDVKTPTPKRSRPKENRKAKGKSIVLHTKDNSDGAEELALDSLSPKQLTNSINQFDHLGRVKFQESTWRQITPTQLNCVGVTQSRRPEFRIDPDFNPYTNGLCTMSEY